MVEDTVLYNSLPNLLREGTEVPDDQKQLSRGNNRHGALLFRVNPQRGQATVDVLEQPTYSPLVVMYCSHEIQYRETPGRGGRRIGFANVSLRRISWLCSLIVDAAPYG